MIATKSMIYLSHLKYTVIFDYLEDKVFMMKRDQAIYIRIVYLQE